MLETETKQEIRNIETTWEIIQPFYQKNPEQFVFFDSKMLERFTDIDKAMETLFPLRKGPYQVFTESDRDGLILTISPAQKCTVCFDNDPLDLNDSLEK